MRAVFFKKKILPQYSQRGRKLEFSRITQELMEEKKK